MTTCVAIPVLTVLSIAQAPVQTACEDWATAEFWRTADPARVMECLEAGQRINDWITTGNWTPLHLAAMYSSDPEVIRALIGVGAILDASSPPANRTPLHQAARHNRNPEIARTLLQYGADTNSVNSVGRTPLHLAALFSENPAVVEELAGVTSVNISARLGETPLHDAARRRPNDVRVGDPNPDIVEVLLGHGSDLSAEALDGGTPVSWTENETVVELIQSESQRRAAAKERFLGLVRTRVVAGAVLLMLLGSLVGMGRIDSAVGLSARRRFVRNG